MILLIASQAEQCSGLIAYPLIHDYQQRGYTMQRLRLFQGAAIASLALLGACAVSADMDDSAVTPAASASARASLYSTSGIAMGTAVVEEMTGGLRLTVKGMALPSGGHGTHIHATGKCDAPDFATAGGHWNPSGKQHGLSNPMGPHAGDLPNMIIGTDGAGSITINLPGATMAGLLDADGAALVIHAQPDDNHTDPSGNSGGRIACGVFSAG